MINLGTQYYRPPFPESCYWEEDMKRIAASGLNAVQLWVVWSWVEPAPGKFRFDDYDRLIELAAANGLGVVLSTIAAIHPYWIHNEVPGSRMVDNMGNEVVSSNRGEIHFGLTPGGCFDHPGVWPGLLLPLYAQRLPRLAQGALWQPRRLERGLAAPLPLVGRGPSRQDAEPALYRDDGL